jgi:hypothetical protein
MLVYHFLPTEYALDDIRRRRLKIATFDALNDPFELWACAQENKDIRKGLRNWKKTMSRRYGVLCFSRKWHNPLLWAHYADKHQGLVLGFEVRDEVIENITYVKTRPALKEANEKTAYKLLFTKFYDWRYEEEWRIFTRLKDRDPETHLFFAEFDEELKLREVIVGPLCECPKSAIHDALGANIDKISIIKSRLAFRAFSVVTNQRGFSRK